MTWVEKKSFQSSGSYFERPEGGSNLEKLNLCLSGNQDNIAQSFGLNYFLWPFIILKTLDKSLHLEFNISDISLSSVETKQNNSGGSGVVLDLPFRSQSRNSKLVLPVCDYVWTMRGCLTYVWRLRRQLTKSRSSLPPLPHPVKLCKFGFKLWVCRAGA